MDNDDFIDKIIKFFLKPSILIEYGITIYLLIGNESWYAVFLAVVIPPIVFSIKPLNIISFVSLSGYYSYLFSTGVYEKGGIWPSIFVGMICLIVSLSVHSYAFLDFSKEETTITDKEENEDEKKAS